MKQEKEINMSKELAPVTEKFSMKEVKDAKLLSDYCMSSDRIMNGIFAGCARSGKTVIAKQFVAELARVKREATDKRLRIVVMDPKKDWRTLARYVEPERFKFYSLGNATFHPINLNPCKVPKGIKPQIWIDILIDTYCRAYGLLELGKQVLTQIIYSLYEDAGVFAAADKSDWKETVPELSSHVTFPMVYRRMEQEIADLEQETNLRGKMGNSTRDAYMCLLERLSVFNNDHTIERQLFGNETGVSIEELLGNDDVIVFEYGWLNAPCSIFIGGLITLGIYQYAKTQSNGFASNNQYETILVLEEADQLIQNLSSWGESPFEEPMNSSKEYGLSFLTVTHRIANMPSSVVENAELVFAHRMPIKQDAQMAINLIFGENQSENESLLKLFYSMSVGECICKLETLPNKPVLINVAWANDYLNDAELDCIMNGGVHSSVLCSARNGKSEEAKCLT